MADSASPLFFIRSIPVRGDLILAPMDGFTDQPFREICRGLGSAMVYTEFVNVDEIAHAKAESAVRLKLRFAEAERPVAIQIYGHTEGRLVEAARRLQDLEPDLIDINLGCSIRKIAERGAGAGMLKDPMRIGRLFASLSAALRIPVSAKMRLGWDERSRNYLEVAKALEENGCALLAVHGRTKEQALSGPVDRLAIAEIKCRARIPVLGNGNVHTVADIEAMKRETGCDGVMIGRAAIGHPWIFARREKESVALPESIAMARRHLGMMVDLYGPRFGCLIFRKHAVRYVHHLESVGKLRTRLVSCANVEEYESLFAEALAVHNAPAA
ncbi:MAG: tRNA-dihydrouridine synthase [Anaerolineales bacterium]|nr:tRNA-dihydrouridine synthase [Anaerolineales bacterium]